MKIIDEKQFVTIIVLSIIIGASVGFVISVFHILTDYILLHKSNFIDKYLFFEDMPWFSYMLLSAIMVFLSVYLVRFYNPESGGSGIQEIEGVAMGKRKMHEFRVVFFKFIGGILSLGASMTMGREGPSVQIGGALGQIASRITNLESEEIRTLVVAGAGAGLAAAFNAPLAGIIFVFEEMRKGVKYKYLSVQSVVTAVVVSIIVLRLLTGNTVAIPVQHLLSPNASYIWIFAVFGILFGLFGYLFNYLLIIFIDAISLIKGWKYYLLVFIIGAVIGLLYYIYPQGVGEGYDAITVAMHGSLALKSVLFMFFVRFFTTMVSYGTGAPGGIFAPMMALGSLLGVAFGIFVSYLMPEIEIEPVVFAIVGMSTLFSATVRAPVTGIVLVSEITMSFDLMLPMLMTSLVATFVVNSLGGRPIYTVLLERTLKIAKFGTKD